VTEASVSDHPWKFGSRSVAESPRPFRSLVFNVFKLQGNVLHSNDRTKTLSKIEFNGGGGLQAYMSTKETAF
jgi:hypothetical protein